MSARRGLCIVCRTSQRLDVDGRLAEHLHRPFPDQPDAVESCAGVGYLAVGVIERTGADRG